MPPAILLSTLNAKYIHASLGLRYLLANMDRHGGSGLRAQTALREFTIARPVPEIVEALLVELGELVGGVPQIIGFGVYIWNVVQTTEVVRQLKRARPTLKIILGGPEVSYEWDSQEIVRLADYLITGWGDVSFPKLCRALLHGPQPLMKVIAGEQPALANIALPYAEFSVDDLAHRLRGARNFKFVDRTFNLKIDSSLTILQFFLDRLTPDLFLHFEVIPDHLPERLKAMIARFPPGVLQFEVGIQTFNPAVQQAISRRQDNEKTCENITWLVNHSHAHLHTDLIFGLPGETLGSFAAGFDRLYALRPHEIQLGVLKRLRGTPIARHSLAYGMVYDAEPPYAIQQTAVVDALTVQRFTRLARYWDLLANSGRFPQTLPILLDCPSPFAAFLAFSDWLWQSTGLTSRLTPEKLLDALFDYLTNVIGREKESVRQILLADYQSSGAHANPACLQGLLKDREKPVPRSARTLVQRQDRHVSVGE